MNAIPRLRTHRITVQLKPLTIGQSLAIAKMSPEAEQAETTAFLRSAIETAEGVENPALWTVEERMLVVCHYLAATSDDGPDFAVGDGHYSDYLDLSKDHAAESLELGEACGDKWRLRPFLGAYADSLERIAGGVKDADGNAIEGRAHWMIGAMAATLIRDSETLPDDSHEGAIDDWLSARMTVFLGLSEPDFAKLAALWAEGRRKTAHLFALSFTDTGIVAMPQKEGAEYLPPCRFPIDACISDFAKAMA